MQTQETDKRIKAMQRLSNVRFDGGIYRLPQGWLSTDGEVLAASGYGTLDVLIADMPKAKWCCSSAMPPPSPYQIRHLLQTTANLRGGYVPPVKVTTRTEPDAVLARLHEDYLERALAEEQEEAERAEAAVVELREKRARGERVSGIQTAVTHAQNADRDVRDRKRMLSKRSSPSFHALKVGDAWVDLRVVRRALRALGTGTGTLQPHGELDPLVLHTRRGVGLVMPFRATAMQKREYRLEKGGA